MAVEWNLCDPTDRAIVLDMAHWQGVDMSWPALVELGIELVIAKTWHGLGRVKTAERQIGDALAHAIPAGGYIWLLFGQDPVAQGRAAASTERNDRFPCMFDVEDPNLAGLSARQALTHAETAVEAYSDAMGFRPTLYTGTWFWKGYLGNLDSQILAECALVIAAYPRLRSIEGAFHSEVARYQAAIMEVCGGKAPEIPLPWASRGIEPLGWQFDGDKGLYLPAEKGGPSKTDVDVNLFSRTRMYELLRLSAPAAPYNPNLPPPAQRDFVPFEGPIEVDTAGAAVDLVIDLAAESEPPSEGV